MVQRDTKFQILVAEDNEINQRVIRAILDKSEFEYVMVKDGFEVLSQYESRIFDLILMDCQMPNLDGLAATQQIRSLERNRDRKYTPIIALTANSMKGDRENCLTVGMDDFLPKPFRMNELLDKIAEWQKKRC